MKMLFREHIKPFIKKPHFGFLLIGIALLIFRLFSSIIPPDTFDAVIITSFYFIAGLGFALLLGYGGLASLGTGAFVGIGSFGLHYVYRFMTLPLSIAILAAILIAILVGILFGFVSLRISGMYLAIVTMGLSQIVFKIITNIPEYASGTSGGFLAGGPRRPLVFLGSELSSNQTIIFIAFFIVLTMMIVHNLIFSPTGRALLSIKNSETAAQTMGISLLKYRLFAFIISAVFGSIAGILAIMYSRGASVNRLGLAFALNILAAVIIGGTKSIWGILLGTFVIYGLNLAVFQRFNLGNYSLLINGVLIIVVVMFYPGGLIQLFGDFKKMIKKAIIKVRERLYGKE